MTLAEKITRAKTDYDDVFDAGYEKGKAEGGGGRGYDLLAKIAKNEAIEILPEDIDAMGITDLVKGDGNFNLLNLKTCLKSFISTKEQGLYLAGRKIFSGFTKLKELQINMISDGSGELSGCTALEKVVCHSSIYFSWGLFQNCYNLKVLDLRGLGTTQPGKASTYDISFVGDGFNGRIVVADGMYDFYMSDAWKAVRDKGFTIVKAKDYKEYVVQ